MQREKNNTASLTITNRDNKSPENSEKEILGGLVLKMGTAHSKAWVLIALRMRNRCMSYPFTAVISRGIIIEIFCATFFPDSLDCSPVGMRHETILPPQLSTLTLLVKHYYELWDQKWISSCSAFIHSCIHCDFS